MYIPSRYKKGGPLTENVKHILWRLSQSGEVRQFDVSGIGVDANIITSKSKYQMEKILNNSYIGASFPYPIFTTHHIFTIPGLSSNIVESIIKIMIIDLRKDKHLGFFKSFKFEAGSVRFTIVSTDGFDSCAKWFKTVVTRAKR